ncbi:MAG: urease accessory protein UreF [Pseudomonadota bacterium]
MKFLLLNLSPVPTPISMSMDNNNAALLQLLRLCSPTLPIGAYAYSQGLESACEQDDVNNQESLYQWIEGLLAHSMQFLDIPIFSRLYDAHLNHETKEIIYWNDYLLASRETHEWLLEDTQMGNALIKLLDNLNLPLGDIDKHHCSLVTAFSLASAQWNIAKVDALNGFIWAWCENQVSIGLKLIPLGQTSGQSILSQLMPHINVAITQGLQIDDNELGASCPGAIIASMQHEDQYSRLFRS